GEIGLTPEDWYSLFLTTLHTNNLAIDDFGDGINSINYDIGSFLVSGAVPFSYWGRGDRRASANWGDARSVSSSCGVRSAVG
ncbi:MAG: hypothetical protein NT003_02540, partial [Candidatus Magasanikbacteria bacterium]|nr:hypothetical protein [Candidatus Magasanikbacteria bacterium]